MQVGLTKLKHILDILHQVTVHIAIAISVLFVQVSANTWKAGTRALMSNKTSTSALFDKQKKFHSFGYEAEDKYSDLALDGEVEGWYFFQRFKMTLFDKLVWFAHILVVFDIINL